MITGFVCRSKVLSCKVITTLSVVVLKAHYLPLKCIGVEVS